MARGAEICRKRGVNFQRWRRNGLAATAAAVAVCCDGIKLAARNVDTRDAEEDHSHDRRPDAAVVVHGGPTKSDPIPKTKRTGREDRSVLFWLKQRLFQNCFVTVLFQFNFRVRTS